MKATHAMAKSHARVEASMAKLSTGSRINSARDDAAGLAISTRFDSHIREVAAATSNAFDGASLISTADGALSEVASILQRIRELTLIKTNGTHGAADQASMQSEIDSLKDEITRIAQHTEFNGSRIFDASERDIVLGSNLGSSITVTLPKVSYLDLITEVEWDPVLSDASLSGTTRLDDDGSHIAVSRVGEDKFRAEVNGATLAHQIEVLDYSYSSTLDISSDGRFVASANTDNVAGHFFTNYADVWDLSSGTSVLSLEGGANWTVKFHGSDIVEFNGFDAQSILYKFDGASWNSFVVDNGFADYYSGVQFFGDNNFAVKGLFSSATSYRSDALDPATVNSSRPTHFNPLKLYSLGSTGWSQTRTIEIGGVDPDTGLPLAQHGVSVLDVDEEGDIALLRLHGESSSDSRLGYFSLSEEKWLTAAENLLEVGGSINAGGTGDVNVFMMNKTVYQRNGIEISKVGTIPESTLLDDQFDISGNGEFVSGPYSSSGGQILRSPVDNLSSLDHAIEELNGIRASLGANLNSLSHAMDNLLDRKINLERSLSVISDTNYATESAEFAAAQIIHQASSAMLAQANTDQESVLTLLRDWL